MKNILVSIDFNENEMILLDKAFQMAESFGSKLWLVHIAAPDPDFVGYEVGPQYVRDSRASELRKEHKTIQEYTSILNKKGVESEGLIIQGATIDMIFKESEKLNIDLIVAGLHKHGFFHKVFFENVSSEIIKKSNIPVLIVPLD